MALLQSHLQLSNTKDYQKMAFKPFGFLKNRLAKCYWEVEKKALVLIF